MSCATRSCQVMAAKLTEKPGFLNFRHRIQFKQVDFEHADECKPHSQPRPMRILRSGMKGTRNKRQHENTTADEQQSTWLEELEAPSRG